MPPARSSAGVAPRVVGVALLLAAWVWVCLGGRGYIREAARAAAVPGAPPGPSSSDRQASPAEPQPPAASPEPDPPQPERPIRFVWADDRPSLRLADVARVDFLLRLQGDVRGSGLEPEPDDVFDLTRRRIGIDGEAFGFLEFQVEREL
ncbi:MAG: hypothetical protein EHM24_32855, partial [Acidobacteria bacterium]